MKALGKIQRDRDICLRLKTLLILSLLGNRLKKDMMRVFQLRIQSEILRLHFHKEAKEVRSIYCLQYIEKMKILLFKKRWDAIANVPNVSNFIASVFKSNFFVTKIVIATIVVIIVKTLQNISKQLYKL